jgi:cyclophilin family peptidyl-prolyl cis-trans isomerase
VRSRLAALDAWEREHPLLFSNPPVPEGAPRVLLTTSRGPIVLGLYSDRAPLHVENFLRLCREGAYNGTKFHRVVRGTLIQGGDPNSIAGEPDTWGSGGFETTLEPESDPQLRHFKGALSAWRKPGETRSSGSQFFLMTADHAEMDGKFTVFGRLLEGEGVVEQIETGAALGDRPQDPVVIESAEVLE